MSINTALIAAAVLVSFAAGYLARRFSASKKLGSVEERIKSSLGEAEARAKEIVLEAKDRAASVLVETKNEERDRRRELDTLGAKLSAREEDLSKKFDAIHAEIKEIKKKEESLAEKESAVRVLEEEIKGKIEKIARLTEGEAREELFRRAKEDRGQDLAQLIQKVEKENREEVERRASGIISTALQRYARSHVSELTTTPFHLADEELKGKIIGREGRNIRAFERATGVELVVDETPDAVVISSFDPYRREVAKMALDKLVKDGRIQPAKIEEKVEEAKEELDKRLSEIGKEAAEEVGIYNLPKEIIQLLGRLHFRTSFGQNVLTHSIEMTYLAGMIAGELNLDVEVAKRGALLHDIGKAIDHDVEGTHIELGMKLLKKYGIDEKIIQAMQSHHEDYPYASSEAYVITAVDVLSAARPGARRGTIENYIKRLADLEKIAMSFNGVKNAYAISAGRELRVFVIPEKIDDFAALEMAREVANKIQAELKYPGEIKVNVIREMRAVEYAR